MFSAAAGQDQPGETITDYQITWAGIPAVMDAFDQRVAAVADIPFTRLMGRSPAGMNAAGQHDTDNWNKAVASGQNLELRPCLEQLDPVLLRSAGVAKPEDVTWRFAPLWTPTEQEEATTFKTFMEAFEKVQATNAIPNEALPRPSRTGWKSASTCPAWATRWTRSPRKRGSGSTRTMTVATRLRLKLKEVIQRLPVPRAARMEAGPLGAVLSKVRSETQLEVITADQGEAF